MRQKCAKRGLSRFWARKTMLATRRLLLAPPEAGDFEESAAMWAEPEVVRFIGGRASTREESWARLLRARGLWALLGYGYWTVREKDTGRFVGEVGFADFHRALEPCIDGSPEMGWVLCGWAHGRGLGTEAVLGALAWLAARQPPGTAVYCIISPENERSLRLAARAGFAEQARTTYKESPTVLLSRRLP